MEYLQQANMPYSRLHDVGGAFGGNRFVDIPNLFRDFDADENDPTSYDFAFTDVLLEGSYLLFVGDDDIISQAFDVSPKDNEVFLPDVMSRKKQVIPSLSAL